MLAQGRLFVALLSILSSGCIGNIGGGDESEEELGGHPQKGPDGRYICDEGPYPIQSFARRISVREYGNVVRDVFGQGIVASAQYPGSYGKSGTGYSTEPSLYAVGDQTAEKLMFAAEDVAEQVGLSLSSLLPCAASAPNGGCVDEFIDTYIARAYRRPVSDEERATLVATYEGGRASGASFAEGVAMLTAHALQTPEFLYVVEAAAPGGRALDGFEIASRMSFFFWETIPDEELLTEALKGTLETPEGRRAQAQRLLDDPRADQAVSRFFREWTLTTDVIAENKDPNIFPGFDDAYAASMGESFDRFVADQARNGTLDTLLTSSDVWVDENMANLLGVEAPVDWAKVSLPERDAGLATQPLFLASAAHYGDSSYIFRGRFVVLRLMCETLGAPPGNAQSEFDAIDKSSDPTGKDLSAVVRANPACGGCHDQIDPGGLALEHFGALGEFREAYESGKPIDPSGILPVAKDLSFDDSGDLFASLAENPAIATCFGKQVVRFALSRVDVEDDGCAVQGVGDIVASEGGSLSDAMIGLIESDAFAYRRD